jgi:hypothetical protein
VSKEIKAGKTQMKEELSEDKKTKIKIFVKDYMNKVIARRAEKQARKSDPGPGPSDSVSTVTPQASGSTPREGDKEGEVGGYTTRASRSISRTPEDMENGDGVVKPSTTKFLEH